MKNFVGYIVLIAALLFVPSCKDADIVKSLTKGVEVLDVVLVGLNDAEKKAFTTPGETAAYREFIGRTQTNLAQAKTIAAGVAALDPDQRKNILTILSTIRAGLNDLDMTGIKDAGTRKKIQAGFLAFGTGIDGLKIALQ